MTRTAFKRHVSTALRKQFERCGLSQSEIAKRTGITEASISQYRNGVRVPSPYELWLLVFALGVTVADVLPPYRVNRE